MTDWPSKPGTPKFIDASQEYPSAEYRTAAWQKEFAAKHSAFRGAFEHAAIGLALVDLDGHFFKVNRSLCQAVGYTEAELLARDFQSITHRDDLEADLTLAGQLLRGEINQYHMEKRYFHKQGHVIWILLSASIVRDDAGNPCYFIAQIQDFTARKAAEQESARRLRHLERLTRTVSGILHALESTPDDTVYSEILSILLDSFESPAGIFLRCGENGTLIGRYLSPDEDRDVRCMAPFHCDPWDAALLKNKASIENHPRPMNCGRLLSRSLVAPIQYDGAPLGLFHLGDCPTDYDANDLDLLTRISVMIAPVIHARLERGKLTPREAEVMDLIVSGKTQKQIASELAISIQTAAKHRARVLEKLHANNDVQLVHFALQMHSLPPKRHPIVSAELIEPALPMRDST